MEKVLFKCFCCEIRLGRFSNELQYTTFGDQYHISFDSTILFKDLPNTFETYKLRVRGKIKYCFFLEVTFSTVKYIFCSERISVKTFPLAGLKKI